MTGSLLLSTAVSVGVMRVVKVNDGVGVIVCVNNPIKQKNNSIPCGGGSKEKQGL